MKLSLLLYYKALIGVSLLWIAFQIVTVTHILFETSHSTTGRRQPLPDNDQPQSESSPPLPVYWVNLNASKDRRFYMEKMFSQLSATLGPAVDPVRVEATTRDDVAHFVATKKYIPTGVDIVKPSEEVAPWQDHLKQRYYEVEVACTMSHLKAILKAYVDGRDFALFVEDDVVLTSQFLLNWKAYADLAPADWSVLQWTSSNEIFAEHSTNLQNDPWVFWSPSYYGTIGYMVSRKGMKDILERSYFKRSVDGSPVWFIDEPEVIVADEVLYFLGKHSYTSTTPWIGTAELSTTLGDVHGSSTQKPASVWQPTDVSSRPERVLVVVTCALKDQTAISTEIQRLAADAEFLSRQHKNSHWIVNVVVTSERLKRELFVASLLLPTCVEIRTHIKSDDRFNKFSFIPTMLQDFDQYDYVLLKDKDVRLTGFPWNVFMERKGDATVSGSLFETVYESLAQNVRKPKRQHLQFFEAFGWRKLRVAEYKTLSPIPVSFVDNSFVLLKADFASWFFKHTLRPWYVSQPMDSGIESMWCGAARAFHPNVTSCVTVPVVVRHEDNRQIDATDTSEGKEDQSILKRFRQHPSFRDWMNVGVKWKNLVKSDFEMARILRHCRIQLNSTEDNLTKCADALGNGYDGFKSNATN